MVKDIGARIAEIRRLRGLNQDELAELATLSRISIARYETGKIEPGAQALGRIAAALEVSSDVLLGRNENIIKTVKESNAPKTEEARFISGGVDSMPKEQREKAKVVMQTLFSEYFKKGNGNDGTKL